MAQQFRLVNYYHLPRSFSRGVTIDAAITTSEFSLGSKAVGFEIRSKSTRVCHLDQWEISRIQQMEVRIRTIFLAIFCGDIP